MYQNTQSINSGGLDGISFFINKKIINQHYFIMRLFSCMWNKYLIEHWYGIYMPSNQWNQLQMK